MRPQTLNQVKDRTYRIGTFDTEKINTIPSLLKPYVALVEAVQKFNGDVNVIYGSNVEFTIPKNRAQLQERLEAEQREWDRQEELYGLVLKGEVIPKYQEYSVKEWAKEERLPEPEFTKAPEEDSVEVS